MQDAKQIQDACRTMEEAMAGAAREADRLHAGIVDMQAKIGADTVLMEQSIGRADRFRLAILDLDPNYEFRELETTSDIGATQQRESDSDHKKRYGMWVRVAQAALKEIGHGTFHQVADYAKKNNLHLANATDSDMEGLRSALHGLSKRTRNKSILYKKGKMGEGGTFVYVNETDEK